MFKNYLIQQSEYIRSLSFEFQGLLANTVTSQTLPNSLDRNIAIEKLETYFSRSTPDQIRQYMLRLRQAANRRLAEQAVDLISTLSSEECAQFLSDIDSDGAAGLN
ncbi:unnamed protein product [Onchocerca flexuosa]|uniref:DUF615 domain-containing protein n=1 Tax=Onchocerca flexuosa TaxID=387005 RepID=A0A183HJV5_9BILA|nr:unnamed protein product [Onchocerca flexuosa]